MNRGNRKGLLKAFICALTIAASLGIAGAESAAAVGCADVYATCTVGGGGAAVGMTRGDLDRAKEGLDIETGAPNKRSFEYTSTYACQLSIPGGPSADFLCAGAVQACAGNTAEQGQGPMVRLYRRELDASGTSAGSWDFLGTTCYPDLAPGKPVLGLGQILAAFHNTPWAKPAVHIQPEGNVTLVTLPTYFAVIWPEAGFEPGEADTTTMLGSQVQIRPTLENYSYVFGDGTTLSPTTSPGGTYPDGDVTHIYPRGGTYNTHVDITFGGEFTIDGGPWFKIPDKVTIAGPTQPLIVKTAHARLVAR